VKIYTRSGDRGETALFGGGRVMKDHDRIEAYGTTDELTAYLGWIRSRTPHRDLEEILREAQKALFDIGAHLATPPYALMARAVLPPLRLERVAELEAAIDRLEGELAPLTSFILPGGTEESALFHVARSVCRRAERVVVAMRVDEMLPLPEPGLAYLNRLSDLLFVMARVVNHRAGIADELWIPERPDGAEPSPPPGGGV
jgi:cob(I)alamin adenosyltransferase